jgi:hypothetical protein
VRACVRAFPRACACLALTDCLGRWGPERGGARTQQQPGVVGGDASACSALRAVRVWAQQEKELRDRERLEVLKRANILLTSQTDRMSALRTQKTLSDVADVSGRTRVPVAPSSPVGPPPQHISASQCPVTPAPPLHDSFLRPCADVAWVVM